MTEPETSETCSCDVMLRILAITAVALAFIHCEHAILSLVRDCEHCDSQLAFLLHVGLDG